MDGIFTGGVLEWCKPVTPKLLRCLKENSTCDANADEKSVNGYNEYTSYYCDGRETDENWIEISPKLWILIRKNIKCTPIYLTKCGNVARGFGDIPRNMAIRREIYDFRLTLAGRLFPLSKLVSSKMKKAALNLSIDTIS